MTAGADHKSSVFAIQAFLEEAGAKPNLVPVIFR